MNIYSEQIKALFNVQDEDAITIRDNMEIDFSECTDEEFYKEAKFQLKRLIIKSVFDDLGGRVEPQYQTILHKQKGRVS